MVLMPRRLNSSLLRLPLRSHLLATRMTGFWLRRAFFAMSRSWSVGYSVLSTATIIVSAATTASSICS